MRSGAIRVPQPGSKGVLGTLTPDQLAGEAPLTV